ncbi:MAG: ribonuclease III domain-containing protein [Nannocystaceae bacterium]
MIDFPPQVQDLKNRSIRTLAWLGDAEFEAEVRRRLALRGDYPTQRLNTVKATLVRAEAQAAFLEAIENQLDPREVDVIARGRNASHKASGRSHRNARAYRAATAFEALIAVWRYTDWTRFETLVAPELERAIDRAIEVGARPRRG